MTDQAIAEVEAIVARARVAQARFERGGSQPAYDRAAQAAVWAIMEPAWNRHLAELAVETTGFGNVPDKIIKNHRKTLGLMRDISGVRTFGVIHDDPATGTTEIARPIGVIGAVVPSTNPGATPANIIIKALKCGNAIVVSPSPKGVPTCEALLCYIHAEFDKLGIHRDLVQMIPGRGSKEKNTAPAGDCGFDRCHRQSEQRETREYLRDASPGGGGRQRSCHRERDRQLCSRSRQDQGVKNL